MRHFIVLAVAVLPCFAGQASAGPVFSSSSYNPAVTLQSGGDTGTGVAYSNGFYYTASGGQPGSLEGKLTDQGVLLNLTAPSPGLDFRSIFTDATGQVFARGYGSNDIYRQTSFGQFTRVVTLAGVVDDQAQVVLNSAGTLYLSNSYGALQEWDLSGFLVRTLNLTDTALQVGTVAAAGGYVLTYADGSLSAYNETTGSLVETTTLVAGGYGDYGSSFANGMFFVSDDTGNNRYLGYQIGLAAPTDVPEPGSAALLGLGMAGVLLASRRRA